MRDYYNQDLDKLNTPTTKSSSTGTADTISSAVSSAIELYMAYRTMKEAPPAVAPTRTAFSMQPTAGQFMDKKGY